jgi:hypothetical protein
VAKIRHEINLIDSLITATADATSSEIVLLDTTQYSGTVTYYFEVVAKKGGAGENHYVSLIRVGTTTLDGTIATGNFSTVYSRQRVAFTPPAGQTQYKASIEWITSGTFSLKSARIIILQDTSTNPLTATETQIEIGAQQTGNVNTTLAPLTNPKYWYYDSTKWDGTCTFYAECTNFQTGSGVITIKLQEDNGSFGSWTDKVTIVNAATPASVTRTRSASFTPTSGRNYRIAGFVVSSMDTWEIYNAKVIVQQTDATAITKLEPQYLLANAATTTTGLNDFDTYFDPAEWSGVTNTYYHEQNASLNTSNTTIRDATASNGSFEGVSQSFQPGSTGSLDKVTLRLHKTGSPADNVVCSIYSGSEQGTLLGTATIASSSLTTSEALYDFTFSPAISVTSGNTYFITLTRSGAADGTNYLTVNSITGNVYANGSRRTRANGIWVSSVHDIYFVTYLSGVSDQSCTGTTGLVDSVQGIRNLGNSNITGGSATVANSRIRSSALIDIPTSATTYDTDVIAA